MANPSRPPFRADQVGSLIRPPHLVDALAKFNKGEIDEPTLETLQRDEIRKVVKLQEDIGFKVVTDGEYNRAGWQRDFLLQFENVETVESKVSIKFHNDEGARLHAPPTLQVMGKLSRPKEIFVDDFRFLKSIATAMPKITIPSPTILHFRGGRSVIDEKAYPRMEDFYEDIARVYREEIADLTAAGCRYLQIDEVNFAYLCDPALREQVRQFGEDPETLPQTYAKLLNALLEGAPEDMTFAMHLCRGNFAGAWVAEGGYDPVAELLFNEININSYFMEYDSPRAGSFEPLRFLPKGKTVVLGLVTTKKGALETKDEIKRRIEEASRFVALDQLALSPQCGFASGIGGETMSVDEEIAKLRLVVEVAEEVWGTA